MLSDRIPVAPGRPGPWQSRKQLAVGIAAFVMLAGAPALHATPSSVVFEGETFVNKGLVGVARVPSNAVDQFGETLGGWGSGIALDPGSWRKNWFGAYRGTLYALPDRGWNTQGTTDYRGRLQRFDLTFQPFYGASTASQNQLTLHYRSSILFSYGKTTGFDASSIEEPTRRLPALPLAPNGHFSVDAEGVVLPGDHTAWISDEYGPYVYHYTLSGKLLDAIRPPEAFIPKRKDSSGNVVDNFSANSPPVGVTYNPSPGNPVTGRQNNQGFEGLAMSPDRKTLFVFLQSALIQDLDTSKTRTTRRNTRLLAYDLRHHEAKLVGEYVVQLPLFQDPATTTPALLTAAQSEIFALNDHQFLVLARDGSAGFNASNPTSSYRSVDLLDISKATNIAGTKYDKPDTPIAPLGVLDSSITPATCQKFLDINDNTELNKFGLRNGLPNDRNNLYEKWEGLAVAPVGDPKAPHDYFLFVASDNDFITQQGNMAGVPYADASGANVDTLVLVYRVTLPTYVPPRHGHGEDRPHGDRRD
jgi:hypothetical protein